MQTTTRFRDLHVIILVFAFTLFLLLVFFLEITRISALNPYYQTARHSPAQESKMRQMKICYTIDHKPKFFMTLRTPDVLRPLRSCITLPQNPEMAQVKQTESTSKTTKTNNWASYCVILTHFSTHYKRFNLFTKPS